MRELDVDSAFLFVSPLVQRYRDLRKPDIAVSELPRRCHEFLKIQIWMINIALLFHHANSVDSAT